jgi:hypothetical protein
MLTFYGSHMYGTIERCGPTRIATRFAHVQFLPLFPLESHLIVDGEGAAGRSVPIALNGRSVAAAYLRTWGLIAAVVFALVGFNHVSTALHGAAKTVMLAVGLVAWALFVGLSFGLGALSPEEQAMRRVYATFAGVPADVALLPAGSLVDALSAEVHDAARSLAGIGYRTAKDPVQEWDTILLDPTMRDPRVLRAAVTLARLEWAGARGARRAALAKSHAALWNKLTDVDPSVMARAA